MESELAEDRFRVWSKIESAEPRCSSKIESWEGNPLEKLLPTALSGGEAEIAVRGTEGREK